LICSVCKQEKDECNFNFKDKSKGKRRTTCKICSREQSRQHYENNKEYYSDRNKKYREKIDNEWNEFKNGLKCCRCGESHIACIVFHHKDPCEKEYTIANKSKRYRLEYIKKELEKCEILCANCHRKEHWENNAM